MAHLNKRTTMKCDRLRESDLVKFCDLFERRMLAISADENRLGFKKVKESNFREKIFVRATLHQLSLEISKRRSGLAMEQDLATFASQNDLASVPIGSAEHPAFADNVASNPSTMQRLKRARRDLRQIIKDRKAMAKCHRQRMRNIASDRRSSPVTELISQHSDCSQSSDVIQVWAHILHCHVAMFVLSFVVQLMFARDFSAFLRFVQICDSLNISFHVFVVWTTLNYLKRVLRFISTVHFCCVSSTFNSYFVLQNFAFRFCFRCRNIFVFNKNCKLHYTMIFKGENFDFWMFASKMGHSVNRNWTTSWKQLSNSQAFLNSSYLKHIRTSELHPSWVPTCADVITFLFDAKISLAFFVLSMKIRTQVDVICISMFSKALKPKLLTTITICLEYQGYTQGGIGVEPPFDLDIFQKLYYLRKGDYLFSLTFCLLICRPNATTKELICLKISRKIVAQKVIIWFWLESG